VNNLYSHSVNFVNLFFNRMNLFRNFFENRFLMLLTCSQQNIVVNYYAQKIVLDFH